MIEGQDQMTLAPGGSGSVQAQRKRRIIMQDNLTNSRGTQRNNNNGSPHLMVTQEEMVPQF